jgi:hypothetical protein
MAAKVPNTIIRDNYGAENVIIASFTTNTLSDTDTWTQTIPGYLGHIFSQTNDPTTQTSAGVSVAYNSTTGVFTFYPGENGAAGEGAAEASAKERFDGAVSAKVAGGMSRYAAMQAVQKEQPALYAAYQSESRPARQAAPTKGGR